MGQLRYGARSRAGGLRHERCVTSGRTVTVNHDRSASLILRVWTEGGVGDFRGRLATVDTSVGREGVEATVATTSSPEDMVDAVRAWLDDFLGRPTRSAEGTR